MTFKNGIIAYLPHKYRANARDKKIIFFAIMKPLKADNAKQNRQSKRKKGLLSWKTQTKRARNLITMLH
ncbi:type I restriction endonuclease subunit M [Helicobacter pylori]|uniref:Type I restriction endonuclease subunit M n=1 Tax=Helicobacter pylori TaxID=210 RepID=A0ABD6HGN4_HELPX|nr:type I restriction endonuclease subunit M [Helicobacter pylori]